MCFDILMLINDLCVAFLQGLIEKRIRPWVNKKIAEYIGEPEPTLTDFICSKVGSWYFRAFDRLCQISAIPQTKVTRVGLFRNYPVCIQPYGTKHDQV